MKHVDFYIVPFTNFDKCIPFCNALLIKAYSANNSCIICTENSRTAKVLDDNIWQAPKDNFIPHNLLNHDVNTIEVIQTKTNNDKPIWINFRAANQTIAAESWERCLQIVPNEDSLLEIARQQYRIYQKHGIRVKSHKIG